MGSYLMDSDSCHTSVYTWQNSNFLQNVYQSVYADKSNGQYSNVASCRDFEYQFSLRRIRHEAAIN